MSTLIGDQVMGVRALCFIKTAHHMNHINKSEAVLLPVYIFPFTISCCPLAMGCTERMSMTEMPFHSKGVLPRTSLNDN